MAVSYTDISHPNSSSTEFTIGPYRAKIIKFVFDSSYPDAGEAFAATLLGWNQIHFAIPAYGAVQTNSGGELAFPASVVPNAAKTSLTIQIYKSDGADGPLTEWDSADVSGYTTGAYLLLGT